MIIHKTRMFLAASPLQILRKDENRKNFNDLSIKSFSENGIRYRVGLNEPMKDKYVKFDTQYRIQVRSINSVSKCEPLPVPGSMSIIETLNTKAVQGWTGLPNPNPDPAYAGNIRNPSIVGSSGGSINISWIAPEDSGGIPLDHYILEVKNNDDEWSVLCEIPAVTHQTSGTYQETGFHRQLDIHGGFLDNLTESISGGSEYILQEVTEKKG